MKGAIHSIHRPYFLLSALALGLALTLTLLLTLVRPAHAGGVIYVDADAAGSTHDGLAWTTAYTNVQDALAAAVSGDEIWVAEGVYYPDQGTGQTEDARTSTFTLKNGVALYGGFPTGGGDGTFDARDWENHVTVLSGDIDGNDVNDDGNYISEVYSDTIGNNAYHVVYSTGATETARLDGFTITAGQAKDGTTHGNGGGILTEAGSPTLTNLIFSGNYAGYFGGGMYNEDGGSPILTSVTFGGNRAEGYGGGVYNRSGDPFLTNVVFSSNRASKGGGMYNEGSPTLTNVTFSSNNASEGGGMYNKNIDPVLINVTFIGNGGLDGGGMYNESSSPILTNVTFSGNRASWGGGMYDESSNPILTNVTLNGNRAYIGGGGMYNYYGSPIVQNSIFWNNQDDSGVGAANASILNDNATPTIRYCLIQGQNPAGDGNLDGTNSANDPLFLDQPDPAFAPTTVGNLRLSPNSPAIDAGNNYSVTVTTDLDGNPRRVDIPIAPDTGLGTAPIVDMGAYETQLIADVTLIKTVSPTAAQLGEVITFTLVFSNSGSITATHVVITDPIPVFLSMTSVASAGVSITDTGHVQPFVWTVQDLAPGQGGMITFSGQLTMPLADGVYTNTATIAADKDVWGKNNADSASIWINVNDTPAFTSAPVTMAAQGALYSYAVAADDPDLFWGDALTLTAPTLPTWLALTTHGDGTATLSGTPGNADVGDHAVVLRVTDGGGLTDTQTFTITVANVNDAPTFASIPVTTAVGDTVYTYTVAVSDPDLLLGDALTLTAPTLPAWLILVDHGNGTATLSGTPANADVGDHIVVLRVTDSGGLTATQSFTIAVARTGYLIYLPLALKNVP